MQDTEIALLKHKIELFEKEMVALKQKVEDNEKNGYERYKELSGLYHNLDIKFTEIKQEVQISNKVSQDTLEYMKEMHKDIQNAYLGESKNNGNMLRKSYWKIIGALVGAGGLVGIIVAVIQALIEKF